jgi:DNA-binding HxlR family transcriptional regulator
VRKRSYDQYCPVAHALDLVGERWAMLVVKELMHGPQRYTDLAEHLPGIGTNILAARLRSLEECGVIAKRKLPPPAASRVYELTDYGRELKPVMRELALWGARSLGPPTDKDELFDGWLANAIDTMLGPFATEGTFEFRVGDEVATLENGIGREGHADDPDVVVTGKPEGLYHLLIEHRIEEIEVEGDHDRLERLIGAASREGVPAQAGGLLTK